jgi:hypothetical protein
VVDKLDTIPNLTRGPRGARQGELRIRHGPRNPGRGSWGPAIQPVGRPFPDPPAGWQDGPAAWGVWWAHKRLGRGPEGLLWGYRVPFGGHISILGFVSDFTEYDLDILIEVYSATDRTGGDPRALILLRTVVARRLGQTYVVIDTEDALTDPTAALRLALAGVSRSQYQ